MKLFLFIFCILSIFSIPIKKVVFNKFKNSKFNLQIERKSKEEKFFLKTKNLNIFELVKKLQKEFNKIPLEKKGSCNTFFLVRDFRWNLIQLLFSGCVEEVEDFFDKLSKKNLIEENLDEVDKEILFLQMEILVEEFFEGEKKNENCEKNLNESFLEFEKEQNGKNAKAFLEIFEIFLKSECLFPKFDFLEKFFKDINLENYFVRYLESDSGNLQLVFSGTLELFRKLKKRVDFEKLDNFSKVELTLNCNKIFNSFKTNFDNLKDPSLIFEDRSFILNSVAEILRIAREFFNSGCDDVKANGLKSDSSGNSLATPMFNMKF